jgi:RNA polymerase-associated protein RTF1
VNTELRLKFNYLNRWGRFDSPRITRIVAMADVDDEFLALVGGDDASDDEEVENSGRSRPVSESPEPEAKQSESTAAAKPRHKRQDDSDEEEEGEA